MSDWLKSTRNKAVVILASLVLAGTWAANLFVLGPSSKQSRVLKLEREKESHKKGFLESITSMQAAIERHEGRLAPESDPSWLIEYVNRTAGEAGLALNSVSPLDREKRGHFVKYPVLIESVCTYRQLGEFLSRIESDAKFIKVHKISAQSLSAPAEGAPLEASVTLTAFSDPASQANVK